MLKSCGREIRVDGKFLRIASLHADAFHLLDNPQPLLEDLKRCGTRIDLFTFMQGLSENSPKYRYPMEWDNVAALTITTFEHWWNNQLRFKVRNRAKQAGKRGVLIRELPFDETLAQGIHAIYNETPIRQGRRFPHFGRDLETVREMSSTFRDQSIFIGAFFEDEVIGFLKLVTDEGQTQAGIMHILSMVRHRDKSPTNALIAQAVRSCAERGIRYLCYGKFSYRKKQRDSLTDFKEGNGFQKIELPRYYVPLTAMGHVALRLGLHHDFTDRVPEPIADTYRRMRSSWFAKRFPWSPKHLAAKHK